MQEINGIWLRLLTFVIQWNSKNLVKLSSNSLKEGQSRDQINKVMCEIQFKILSMQWLNRYFPKHKSPILCTNALEDFKSYGSFQQI